MIRANSLLPYNPQGSKLSIVFLSERLVIFPSGKKYSKDNCSLEFGVVKMGDKLVSNLNQKGCCSFTLLADLTKVMVSFCHHAAAFIFFLLLLRASGSTLYVVEISLSFTISKVNSTEDN